MRIAHHIGFNTKHESHVLAEIKRMGIPYNGDSIVSAFDIYEDDVRWPIVKKLVDQYDLLDLEGTVFTPKEIKDAAWHRLHSTWHSGYPMPDMDFGYRNKTYDLSHYDEQTGIGLVQNAPFLMKSEPKWGKKHILQLFWVDDVFFTLPEVWESVFRPLGIECGPVLKYKSKEVLKTVVQVKSQGVVPPNPNLKGYPMEGRKYLPINRGFHPEPNSFAGWDGHYMLSHEYFGSGAAANKAVLVSKEFYRAIQDNKLKGVAFHPLSKVRYEPE